MNMLSKEIFPSRGRQREIRRHLRAEATCVLREEFVELRIRRAVTRKRDQGHREVVRQLLAVLSVELIAALLQELSEEFETLVYRTE